MVTNYVEEISSIFQKDFVYFGLEKKDFILLQANLIRFIKAISYYYFFLLNQDQLAKSIYRGQKNTKRNKRLSQIELVSTRASNKKTAL